MSAARRLAVVPIAFAIALVGGCASTDGVAGSVGNAGYVAGSGNVTEIAVADRADAVQFEGETVEGEQFSSAQLDDTVTVVNFWYAACPPCRIEAPVLASLDEEFADDDVQFLGVNVRDGAAAAQAFDEEFGIEYPSILDADDAAVQLAFTGVVAPNAVPTTLILDREGRVAARYSGAITASNSTIISTLISDALAG